MRVLFINHANYDLIKESINTDNSDNISEINQTENSSTFIELCKWIGEFLKENNFKIQKCILKNKIFKNSLYLK